MSFFNTARAKILPDHPPSPPALHRQSSIPNSVTKDIKKPEIPQRERHIVLPLLFSACFLMFSFSVFQLFTEGWNPNEDIRIAFIGNSIQYYNDCPRLMESISGFHVIQNSCLRGGASLKTILRKGNGMKRKWNTTNARTENGTIDIGASTVYELLLGDNSDHWDYVVVNDRTYHPATNTTLIQGEKVLKEKYLPMFLTVGATPIFIANHATRSDHNRTTTFGDFENYTHLLLKGYNDYKEFLDPYLPDDKKTRVAPVGKAFLLVYEENEDLWYRLYHTDGLHPSPHGTYLQACVIYCTIHGHPPPEEYALPNNPSNLFSRARVMQPYGMPPNDEPTLAEAQYLYEVATRIALTDYRVVTSRGWERSLLRSSALD